MSRPLDNVNPTIFAPTASSSTRRHKSAKALLWDEEAFKYAEFDDSPSEDEMEEIDAQEVYGEPPFSLRARPQTDSDLNDRSVEIDIRP